MKLRFAKKIFVLILCLAIIMGVLPGNFGITKVNAAGVWTFADGGLATGINQDTGKNVWNPAVIEYNGELYVAWQEYNGAQNQIRVKKYDGASWVSVDGGRADGLNFNPSGSASFPSFAVNNGNLYLGWSELRTDVAVTAVHVVRYDGGSSWTFIDDDPVQGLDKYSVPADKVKLLEFDGELYAIWQESINTTIQIRVKKYDGSSWTFIDGGSDIGLNKDTSVNALRPELAVYNNDLYAVWAEPDTSGILQVRVKRYDGGSSWTFVDGDGAEGLNYDPEKHAGNFSITDYNGSLYVFWEEADYFYEADNLYCTQVRVKEYDGAGWTWGDGGTTAGLNRNNDMYALNPSATVYGNKIYLAWSEEGTSPSYIRQIRAVEYDGVTRTLIDGSGDTGLNYDPSQVGECPVIAEYNGDLYIVWYEMDGGVYQIRAKCLPLPPFISSVSVPENDTYIIDQDLDFTVNFNKSVNVTGNPYIPITLDTGGTVNATYISGSGTSTSSLTFRYTVADGNLDTDGITVGAAISPNGGTLRDSSLNDAVLDLNNIGSTTGVLVDADKPEINSATITDNTHITVTLSENCTNIAKANDGGFTVTETGAPATAYAVSAIAQGADASHVVLTVTNMGVSAKEGVTVTYTAGGNGTVQDTLGNAMVTDGTGVTAAAWDTAAPTIDSGTLAASSAYIDVQFNEGIYGANDGATALSAAKLSLTFTQNGGTATDAVISSVKQNNNAVEGSASALVGGETTVRVFLAVTGEPDGSETIEIKPANDASIYDLAGNAMLAAQTTGTKTLNDLNLPELVSAVRADNTHITVTLSKNCTNIAKANDGGFKVTETGTPATAYAVSAIAQGADASHVVLTVANMGVSAKEGVTVTYTAGGNGTVQDTLGNAIVTDGTGVTVAAWDTAAPTIDSGTLAASNAYVDVRFNEGIYGANDGTTALSAAKLSLTFTQNGGTATDAVISSVKQNDNTVEGSASALVGGETTVRVFLAVTGEPNGSETIEIKPANAASIYDLAGNAMLAAQTTGTKTLNDLNPPKLVSAVRTDNTHITVTLSKNCANIAKANDGGFTVTETGTPATAYAVSATAQGADASHVVLTVANMGVSAKEGVTVTYTAGGNGTVQDTLGNAIVTDGTGVTVAAWDTAAPTIDSGTLAASNAYVDVRFNEGIYGANDGTTALSAAKLSLTFTQNGGTATDAVISSVKQNNNAVEGSASALVGGETTVRVFLAVTGEPNGSETIEIKPANAASIYDLAGNAMLAAQTTGTKTLNDLNPPKLVSAVRTDNTHITVTLSKNCANIAKANDGGFKVTETGTPATAYAVSAIAQGADASHVVLTVANMGVSAKEGVTVTYTAGGNGTVQDTLGNAMVTDGTGVIAAAWDTAAPTIDSGTLAASNAYVDVRFNEGIYGANDGTTALSAAKLSLTFTQNGGTATDAVISSVKQNNNAVEGSASALVGGETTVRVFLAVTGTPDGLETVEIKPVNGTSIYDKAGNAMLASQTTGVKNLADQTSPPPPPPATSTHLSAPPKEKVVIEINGESIVIGESTTKTVEGRTVTTIVIDRDSIEEILSNSGINKIVIPVNNNADVVTVQLNGHTIQAMEDAEAVLEIRTSNVTYTIPASEINVQDIAVQFGIDTTDTQVNISISSPSEETVKVIKDSADNNNYQLVIQPVEFLVTCTNGQNTVEISRFSSYVERMIAIPDGIDPSRITTGVVLNSDGTFSHVPTAIITIDGKYYARINSLTNSIYSVIWNPISFTDMHGHWADEAVCDLASRLIVSGENGKFMPNQSVTRSEFIDIVVKALGLYRSGTTGITRFSDVKAGGKYSESINIAYEYGIISGYGDGTFCPDKVIKRQESMIILRNAMRIVKVGGTYTQEEISKQIDMFSDADQVWICAREAAAACIDNGIFVGSGGKLAANDLLTRAQAATIVRKLLIKAGLIQ